MSGPGGCKLKPDTMRLAQEERADLAELLATLTPEQWNAPSLCTGWRVRDVVAHIFSYEGLGAMALAKRFITGGLTPDRVNAYSVDKFAEAGPAELLARVHTYQRPRGLAAGLGGRLGLTDGLIHHQDIRRPLGLPRRIPDDRLRCTLDFARRSPIIGAAKRMRGLALVATDLEWKVGKGPVVEGTGEALLMAIAGRHGITAELTGPGKPLLAERIDGRP